LHPFCKVWTILQARCETVDFCNSLKERFIFCKVVQPPERFLHFLHF
ncbi:hypothetical protein HMPREF1869_00555, partial [Bacteroidales bacterium KA00251]